MLCELCLKSEISRVAQISYIWKDLLEYNSQTAEYLHKIGSNFK